MGLDMYLTKRIYVGGHFEHNKAKGTIHIEFGDRNEKTIDIDVKEVSEIILQVGYWRKANQIHNWFVENCQKGVDECQETLVPHEKLLELKTLCEFALNNRFSKKLPPTAGFFFGSTKVDQYYWEDLELTVKILSNIDENYEYYYRASW